MKWPECYSAPYWTIWKRGDDAWLRKLAQIPPRTKPEFPHKVLCDMDFESPEMLLAELKANWDWDKRTDFRRGETFFARIETTRTGIVVTAFPSYKAAAEAHRRMKNGEPRDCPFCGRHDRLEIIGWECERDDGTEYSGDAVRCNRCDAIAPIHIWQRA